MDNGMVLENRSMAIAALREPGENVQQLAAEVQGLRHREASLRAKNDFLYDLINGINEGIGIVDEEENLIFCNPAYASILGRDPGEIVGHNLLDFLRGEDRAFTTGDAGQPADAGAQTFDVMIVTPLGIAKEIRTTLTPRIDLLGKVSGFVASIVDVTPRSVRPPAVSHVS